MLKQILSQGLHYTDRKGQYAVLLESGKLRSMYQWVQYQLNFILIVQIKVAEAEEIHVLKAT